MKAARRFQKPKCHCARGILLAIVFAASVFHQGSAQAPNETTVSFFAGASEYDLSGVGWTAVFGPRIDHTLRGPLAVQFALPVYSYVPQFAPGHLTWILPELSLLLSPTIGRVSPYLRFGPGWAIVVSGKQYGNSEETLHVALGARVQVSRSWDLRSEFCIRSINPWAGSTVDIGGGIGYRF